MTAADLEHQLGPGDALTFSPREPHTWANASVTEPTFVLWVMSPSPYGRRYVETARRENPQRSKTRDEDQATQPHSAHPGRCVLHDDSRGGTAAGTLRPPRRSATAVAAARCAADHGNGRRAQGVHPGDAGAGPQRHRASPGVFRATEGWARTPAGHPLQPRARRRLRPGERRAAGWAEGAAATTLR